MAINHEGVMQMTAELTDLIQSTATEYNKFCQERIEIMSHLECLSTEKAEEEKHGLEPLPKFEDGPDEVYSPNNHLN